VSAPLHPLGDLVACAWAKSVLGLTDSFVGTTLPPLTDPQTGLTKPWAATGFVVARIVGGGSPVGLAPMRRSVVQFDAYAMHAGSGKPLWNLANGLLERLWRVCLAYNRHGAPSAPLALRAGYANATVVDASALTEPRRVPGDPARHGRYTMDIALMWAPTDWIDG
jgi:hypothetical protein